MNDEWSSLLLGIFMIKKCVEFNLTSFGTLKYNCVIKTIEILRFLPLINHSVTIESNLLLLMISAIISSKIINIIKIIKIINYNIDILLRMDPFHRNIFYQYLVDYLLNLIMHLFFLIQTTYNKYSVWMI